MKLTKSKFLYYMVFVGGVSGVLLTMLNMFHLSGYRIFQGILGVIIIGVGLRFGEVQKKIPSGLFWAVQLMTAAGLVWNAVFATWSWYVLPYAIGDFANTLLYFGLVDMLILYMSPDENPVNIIRA